MTAMRSVSSSLLHKPPATSYLPLATSRVPQASPGPRATSYLPLATSHRLPNNPKDGDHNR
jgi:hypothetical protein